MQIALKCKISLSKKMRNILQNGGSIVLTADSINSGKGEGTLILSDHSNNQINADDLMSKETSIMITPTSIDQGGMNASVSHIFSNNQQQTAGVGAISNQQRTPVDRLAATQPPEPGQNNRSYYTPDELEVPRQFEQTQDPSFLSYIKTYQELISAVKDSKDKRSDIQVEIFADDPINVKKEKAMLMERKAMEESIGMDAYVVNENCASLTINDIGLDLPLNMPKNLGTVSARKLASSRDLWHLFKQKLIRIISPNEANHLLKNAGDMNEVYVPGLEIYDSRYEAEDDIYTHGTTVSGERGVTNATMLDLEATDLAGDSEEMRMLRMAGGNSRPATASGGSINTLSGNTRRSFHGSGETQYASDIHASEEFAIREGDRQVPTQSRRNSKGAKTVASRHSRRRF